MSSLHFGRRAVSWLTVGPLSTEAKKARANTEEAIGLFAAESIDVRGCCERAVSRHERIGKANNEPYLNP